LTADSEQLPEASQSTWQPQSFELKHVCIFFRKCKNPIILVHLNWFVYFKQSFIETSMTKLIL